MISSDLKLKLYKRCLEIIDSRISTCREAIRQAQEAANEETKSSAGDKYETGRAMMQLDIEKNSTQLNEALKQKAVLDRIAPQQIHEAVRPGSLVFTDQGNFFIAISVGMLELEGVQYAVVSENSPIGSVLLGLKAGAQFTFGNKRYTITQLE